VELALRGGAVVQLDLDPRGVATDVNGTKAMIARPPQGADDEPGLKLNVRFSV